jgi:glycosyltransferase involved in cell wall biosynthesis
MTRSDAKRMSRVLMLVTDLTFGGAEAQVVKLAAEMKQRGLQVCVVSMMEPKVWLECLREEVVDVRSLEMKRGVPDARAIFRLRRIIKEFSPDVVHCHMFHANLLGRITRMVCRIPTLICTVHNLHETSEKGGPTFVKEMLYRITDALCTRTTIICDAAFQRYVRVGAVPASRLELVFNGVDVDSFTFSDEQRSEARRQLGVESKFVWLAVGRLAQQKDYPTLFRAVARLAGSEHTVLIAGGGPLKDELISEAARLGVSDKIRFLGTREDIRHLYCAADAYVMSSKFEGFSMALLEASCMKLPIVATDAGGNREIVQHRISGYIVPTCDPARLAEGMSELMSLSPEQRRSMGQAGRAFCISNFDIQRVVNRWIELYEHYSDASAQDANWKQIWVKSPDQEPRQ